MTKAIIQVVTVSFVLFIFLSLIYIYYKFKKIKVINTKDTLEATKIKMQQLKIVSLVDKISHNKFETLIRLSKNPYNLTPEIFGMLFYIVPFIVILFFLFFNLIGESDIAKFAIVLGVVIMFLPYAHYSSIVKDRESAWFKVDKYMFKLEEFLIMTDYKPALNQMSHYLLENNEIELSEGFMEMYKFFPDSTDFNSMAVISEFEKMYPFQLSKSLYQMLLISYQVSADVSQRIQTFQKTTELEYNKFLQKQLQAVPSITTAMTLPFVMLTAIVILLLPALVTLKEFM